MDPGPSSSIPDPHPHKHTQTQTQPPPDDRWAVVPDGDAAGADAPPRVVEWEELQQELARLWSLSAAAAAARDRRAHLRARLESALEVRKAFLQQENELAEMRQRLQEYADFVGDLKMRKRELSVDVEDRREKLCVMIRNLSLASKTLCTLRDDLQEADKLLSAENGHGRLKDMRQMLRVRQQYMITQVCQIYPVKPLHEQTTVDKSGLNSRVIRIGDAESMSPNGSRSGQTPLAILGLQLSKLSIKKTSYFSDKSEIQESATALGYVAHAVSLISSYLDVPLRYPLRLGGSHSYVLDHAPSVEPSSITSGISSTPLGMSTRTMEFPLFFEGQETTRSAYAVFLLNKDIEQLLNHIGVESLGPRHVLANLKHLTTIIQSPQYISD